MRRPIYVSTAFVVLLACLAAPGLQAQRLDARAVAEAEKMRESRSSAADVASRMQRGYRQSGAQTTAILKQVGFRAEASAAGVRTSYRSSFEDLSEWMQRAGYEPESTVSALRGARAPLVDVVEGLQRGGARSESVGAALKRNRVTGAEAVRALSGAGLTSRVAVDGLGKGGYTSGELKGPVQAEYSDRAEWLPAVTSLMIAEGALDPSSPLEMAEEARSLRLSTAEAVQWMEDQGTTSIRALVGVAQAGYPPEEVGTAAQSRVEDEEAAREFAGEMMGVGIIVSVIVVIIMIVIGVFTFGAGAPVVAGVLLAAGLGVGEVVSALDEQGVSPSEIVDGLLEAGVSTGEVVMTMKEEGVGTVLEMMEALYGTGMALTEVMEAMFAAEHTSGSLLTAFLQLDSDETERVEVLALWISETGLSLGEAADALVDVGAEPPTVAAALGTAFDHNAETIALYLKLAGFEPVQTAEALREGLDLSWSEVVEILRNQSVPGEDIGMALDALGLDPEPIAALLVDGIMTVYEVQMFLINRLQLMQEEVAEILRNIGGGIAPGDPVVTALR